MPSTLLSPPPLSPPPPPIFFLREPPSPSPPSPYLSSTTLPLLYPPPTPYKFPPPSPPGSPSYSAHLPFYLNHHPFPRSPPLPPPLPPLPLTCFPWLMPGHLPALGQNLFGAQGFFFHIGRPPDLNPPPFNPCTLPFFFGFFRGSLTPTTGVLFLRSSLPRQPFSRTLFSPARGPAPSFRTLP